VPADHRLRLEDFQCVQYSRSHMIERGRHQPVNVAERQSLRGFAPQHVELMSKDEVLGLQRSPRPEHSNQGAPDQPTKVAHRQRVSADSRSRSAVLSLRLGQGLLQQTKVCSRGEYIGEGYNRAKIAQKVRFNGNAGSSFAGSTTPTISSALSNLPAPSSSSNDFEIGSSQNLRGIGYHHFQETGPAERCGACVSCERAGCQLQ
jgi:hypothetical protein